MKAREDKLGGDLGVFRTLWYAVKLCAAAKPLTFAVLGIVSAMGAAMSPVVVLLSQQLINDITRSLVADIPTSRLIWTAVWLGLATRLGSTATNIAGNHQGVLAREVTQHAQVRFYEAAATADIGRLDDATWHDQMARASLDITYRPGQLVSIVFALIASTVGLLGLFSVLASLHPVLLVLVAVANIPGVFTYRWVNRKLRAHQVASITAAREKEYIGSLLTEPRASKEIRAFGIVEWLLQRHQRRESEISGPYTRVVWATHWGQLLAGVIPAGAMVVAYAFVAVEGKAGRFGPGALAAIVAAYASVNGFVAQFLGNFNQLDQHNALFLSHYFEFLETSPLLPTPDDPVALPEALADGVELRGVRFTYPFGSGPALDGVDLVVRPGEMLAIVGDNGAGKTTIVKLLLRFYLPDQGSVLVGGVDVRDVDPSALRSRIGVLFQDYVPYEFTAAENVTIGRVDADHTEERLTAALAASRADTVVARLPAGAETKVGKLFSGGHDLSGGEWQRLALARLLYRDASIWILDEPTSALDPEAEAAIFAELRRKLADRIGIVISHRFSTVRIADRIAVVSSGRITELGSHAELLALGGRYAELFEIQAAGYR